MLHIAERGFPPEIIEYSVWLYFRFSLSLCDVEDLLAERGIVVGHETVVSGGLKAGHFCPFDSREGVRIFTGRQANAKQSPTGSQATYFNWSAGG